LLPWQHQLSGLAVGFGQNGQASGCVGPIDTGYQRPIIRGALWEKRFSSTESFARPSLGQMSTGNGIVMGVL
jgi:hypothetical protein